MKRCISASSSGRIGRMRRLSRRDARSRSRARPDRAGWRSAPARLVARRRLAHDDARIERDHAVGVDQQRIDVELGDLAHVGDQLRQADHRLANRAARRRRAVAIAAQQAIDARAAQRILGQHRIERRQRQRLVVDHLGRDAAMADHQDRPEHRVLGRAQDQLDGVRPLDHRLHDEAVDAGAGRGGADLVVHQRRRRRAPPARCRDRAPRRRRRSCG